MLYPRIIPCLLVHNKGLVKTVQFAAPKYVGDPINAVRIFNEKEVDELIVLDIDASRENRAPDFNMIENLAAECRMPLCYGGGVTSAEQAQKIFNLGVEKVAVNTAAILDPHLVSRMAVEVGNQSVVVVLDCKKSKGGKYEIFINNSKKGTGLDPVEMAKKYEQLGAGEIVINSIDNDGMMKGYDMELIDLIKQSVNIPITVLGGAGKLADIGQVIRKHNIIGVSAGSLFVFKGIYKAVLINYPNEVQKLELLKEYFQED